MSTKQSITEDVQKLIRAEKRADYKRYRLVNEIVRRQIKFKNIPAHNLIVASKKKSLIKKDKREYLKTLKEARKKARKNVGKKGHN